jgi:hypothetical protein
MKRKVWIALLAYALISTAACETDDVEGNAPYRGPDVVLTVDKPSIIEQEGIAILTATLASSFTEEVTLALAFSGTAEGNGTDYSISASEIIIPSGSLSGTITVQAAPDTLEEGNETVVVSLISINEGDAGSISDITITIEDDDVPLQSQIIVNEILYDPSNNGLNGDANGDGQYAQSEDEFIEFLNVSSQDADLSGFQIFDTEALNSGTPRHVFAQGTLVPSGKPIVVFGGGTPTGSFGGAQVQTSTTGNMNLNNAGDVMTLTDANGEVIVTFEIEPLSNNPNESYTRNPDITGAFEQHGDNFPILFSPGTRVDGAPF